jgi:hypothetical protein
MPISVGSHLILSGGKGLEGMRSTYHEGREPRERPDDHKCRQAPSTIRPLAKLSPTCSPPGVFGGEGARVQGERMVSRFSISPTSLTQDSAKCRFGQIRIDRRRPHLISHQVQSGACQPTDRMGWVEGRGALRVGECPGPGPNRRRAQAARDRYPADEPTHAARAPSGGRGPRSAPRAPTILYSDKIVSDFWARRPSVEEARLCSETHDWPALASSIRSDCPTTGTGRELRTVIPLRVAPANQGTRMGKARSGPGCDAGTAAPRLGPIELRTSRSQ